MTRDKAMVNHWPLAFLFIYIAFFLGIVAGGPFEWFKTANTRDDLLVLIGLIGLPFLFWRTRSQSRSADAALNSAEAALRSAEAALKNSEIALKQATDAETKNLSEQFAKAVEQLGSDHVYIRVGAIVIIEQVFQARPDHYRKIMVEILVAFVRHALRIPMDGPDYKEWAERQAKRHIKEVPARRADVAIALKVLGRCRREVSDDNIEMDFALLDLQGANLIKGNFRSASFFRARLLNANLGFADLTGANLSKCIAKAVKARETNFLNANCDEADFSKANLSRSVNLTPIQVFSMSPSPGAAFPPSVGGERPPGWIAE